MGDQETSVLELPAIHLNGTSREALLEQNCKVGNALVDALNALSDAAPNGRDYYTKSPNAFKRAIAEHLDRCNKIKTVLAEVEQIVTYISDHE